MVRLNFEPFTITIGNDTRSITLSRGEVLKLFQGKTLLAPRISSNEFGLMSTQSLGRNGKLVWTWLKGPHHIFKARANGCVWASKGTITHVTDDMQLTPIEMQLEQCVDALWTEAFETLLGVGRDVRNMIATPEGQRILQYIIERIFNSMVNSTNELVWWGKHAAITSSNTNNLYTLEKPRWDDFVEQQDLITGLHTTVASQATVFTGWNIAIAAGDVSGSTFTGASNNITTYFQSLIDNASVELRTLATTNPEAVAIPVTPSLFKAYKAYLLTTYGSLDAALAIQVEGRVASPRIGRNVLYWDGIEIINMTEWDLFNSYIGGSTVYVHLAYLVAKGVFGVGYDVNSLDERDIGLDITTWDVQPYKGKTFIDGDFKLGAGILDTDMLARAHISVGLP